MSHNSLVFSISWQARTNDWATTTYCSTPCILHVCMLLPAVLKTQAPTRAGFTQQHCCMSAAIGKTRSISLRQTNLPSYLNLWSAVLQLCHVFRVCQRSTLWKQGWFLLFWVQTSPFSADSMRLKHRHGLSMSTESQPGASMCLPEAHPVCEYAGCFVQFLFVTLLAVVHSTHSIKLINSLTDLTFASQSQQVFGMLDPNLRIVQWPCYIC